MQFNFEVDGTLRHGATSVELSTGTLGLQMCLLPKATPTRAARAETTQLSDFQPLHLPVESGYASWPPGS